MNVNVLESVDELANFELVFLPWNSNHVHWTLIVLNVGKGTMDFYDSIEGFGTTAEFPAIAKLLKEKYPALGAFQLNVVPNAPQQVPGSTDCGVFVCAFADYLCKGKAFDFHETKLSHWRAKILVELISNSKPTPR